MKKCFRIFVSDKAAHPPAAPFAFGEADTVQFGYHEGHFVIEIGGAGVTIPADRVQEFLAAASYYAVVRAP